MSETKSGMPSPALTEAGIRKVMIEVLELKKNIEDLRDRFENGVLYNEIDNNYVLVWTQKELEEAKKEANEIYNTFFKDLQQDTTGDQVECTDTQAEWATFQDSPTAD